jgi:Uncharacterized conserved protein
MGKKLIVQACLCGAGTTKKQNPNVPITPDEIAANVVNVAKAGAAIAHIHVRDKDGVNCMDADVFKEVCDKAREGLARENLDIVLNLTTSGSKFSDEQRLGHLPVCKPEMCSYDPGTLNWGYQTVFLNTPTFLEKLGLYAQELGVKPEVEIFDAGMMGAVDYYVAKGILAPPVHYQFVLGVAGGMMGDAESLAYLLPKMRAGSTWSITGIGRYHMPCMLLGLAEGTDGLRVGLEDNIYYDKGVLATNVSLVERACKMSELAGRSVATAQEAREILGLAKP